MTDPNEDIIEKLQNFREGKPVEITPPPAPEAEPAPNRSIGDGYALGIHFFSCVMVGGAMGFGLDKLFGTKPWLMLVFLLLGFVAAFRAIWAFLNKK